MSAVGDHKQLKRRALFGMYFQWCTLQKDAEYPFFFNTTNDLNLDQMWFQQNDAHCTSNKTSLSYYTSEEWHQLATEVSRSDPIRFFSVGLFKGEGLCQQISYGSRDKIRAIDEIEQHLCEIVIEKLAKTVVPYQRYCRGYFADIIFHL